MFASDGRVVACLHNGQGTVFALFAEAEDDMGCGLAGAADVFLFWPDGIQGVWITAVGSFNHNWKDGGCSLVVFREGCGADVATGGLVSVKVGDITFFIAKGGKFALEV